MILNRHITVDPEILGGTPVFRGTRVPVETLFDHVENGISLEEFLDDFPGVERETVLEISKLKNLSNVVF